MKTTFRILFDISFVLTVAYLLFGCTTLQLDFKGDTMTRVNTAACTDTGVDLVCISRKPNTTVGEFECTQCPDPDPTTKPQDAGIDPGAHGK